MQTVAAPEHRLTLPNTLTDNRVAPATANHDEFLLVDGSRVIARYAAPSDLESVRDLHRRCSMATRSSRYHSGKPNISAAEWRYFTDITRGTTLVVAPADQPALVVAVLNLMRTPEPGQVEFAVLIEDEWQSRRLGTALVRHAVALARLQGYATLTAVIQSSNRRALAALQRQSATVSRRTGPTVELMIRLSPSR